MPRIDFGISFYPSEMINIQVKTGKKIDYFNWDKYKYQGYRTSLESHFFNY